jgi:hypothetical protein
VKKYAKIQINRKKTLISLGVEKIEKIVYVFWPKILKSSKIYNFQYSKKKFAT